MPTKSNSPTNSGDLSDRDLAILRHVGLYGLTFPHPVQRLFFPEVDFDDYATALQRAGNALHGLASAKVLTSTHSGKPLSFNKDFRYWILTAEGQKRIGVKASKAKPPSDPNKLLATLWACTMEGRRFHLLDSSEVSQLFPENPPHHHIAHALAEAEVGSGRTTPVIYRLYPTTAEPKQVIRQAQQFYNKTLSNDSIRPLLEVGDYGFAILVPSEERRKSLQKLLSKAEGDGPSLSRLARFTVRLGPTTDTLRQAVKSLDSGAT